MIPNSIEDVWIAYRKAKVDAFYERGHPTALAFAEFESDLAGRLTRLFNRLCDASDPWWLDSTITGTYSYIPKPIAPQIPADDSVSLITSDPAEAWSREGSKDDSLAKFRIVGRHPVEFHVICALWILTVGHKYDAALSDSAMGSRLRRCRPDNEHAQGKVNTLAMGSFRPYAQDFRQWRARGLRAIRTALEEGHEVLAITTDLKQFYHKASADYLVHDEYLQLAGIALTEDERAFTDKFAKALASWNSRTPQGHGGLQWTGLPVGISAPRIVANCLLLAFDRFVEQELTPLYYGRYVDDVFLVLKNTRKLRTAEAVWEWLVNAAKSSASLELVRATLSSPTAVEGSQDSGLKLTLRYSANSDLLFSDSKSKIFELAGDAGIDLANAIEDNISAASSEWRLLPDLSEDGSDIVHSMLAPSRSASDESDNLRKSDGVSVRKLRFALRLRDLEAVERDLHPTSWSAQRQQFGRAVRNHVVTPRGIFEQGPYLARIVGLMVAAGDWHETRQLIRRLRVVLDAVSSTPGIDENEFSKCREHIFGEVRESMAKAFDYRKLRTSHVGLDHVLRELALAGIAVSREELTEDAKRLFRADLARTPWRGDLLEGIATPDTPSPVTLSATLEDRLALAGAREFVNKHVLHSGASSTWPLPIVFPTRPLSTAEITLLDPDCLRDLTKLKYVALGLRGATLAVDDAMWTAGSAITEEPDLRNSNVVCVPWTTDRATRRVALSCYLTDDASWRAMVVEARDPNEADRYFRLNRLINGVLRQHPHVDYVVMPELCLPERWFNRIAHKCGQSGISVISGLTYKHHAADDGRVDERDASLNLVANRARVSLITDALGYRTTVMYTQEKCSPALEEENQLWNIGQKRLQPIDLSATPRIVEHGGFHFGVLICSDLTDIQMRQQWRGGVDALFILEWNRDTESFAALVEASALDLHCFVVQVNNRMYGDCRVRAPFRETFKRDVARIRGGVQDYHVVAEIDVPELRAFHSRGRSSSDGVFKPVPTGFALSHKRRVLPK